MQVADIAGTFGWGPFLPVKSEDPLLTLLLLVSKYRLECVPVVDGEEGSVKCLATQSSNDCSPGRVQWPRMV